MARKKREDSDERKTNGGLFKTLRDEKGYTQPDVARLTGISEKKVRNAEKHNDLLDAEERMLRAFRNGGAGRPKLVALVG